MCSTLIHICLKVDSFTVVLKTMVVFSLISLKSRLETGKGKAVLINIIRKVGHTMHEGGTILTILRLQHDLAAPAWNLFGMQNEECDEK